MTTPSRPTAAERRAYLVARLAQGTLITRPERRQLAQVLQCEPATIWRDLRALRAAAAPPPPAVPDAVGLAATGRAKDARILAVLRLLGRLKYVRSDWISGLIFPEQSLKSMRVLLHNLVTRELVQRVPLALEAPRDAAGKPMMSTLR